MSTISTHVLDTVLGKPAPGIKLWLEMRNGTSWSEVATSTTDADGRCSNLKQDAMPGVYRLTFDTGDYFAHRGRTSIYPSVSIIFACGGETHYHLPLLLSDNGYTTYRGS